MYFIDITLFRGLELQGK